MARFGCKTLLLYNRFGVKIIYQNLINKVFSIYTPIITYTASQRFCRLGYFTNSSLIELTTDSGWLEYPNIKLTWNKLSLKYVGEYYLLIHIANYKYKFKYRSFRCRNINMHSSSVLFVKATIGRMVVKDFSVSYHGDMWQMANQFVTKCLEVLEPYRQVL